MRYKVINRFNGEWWSFDSIDGRISESTAKHLIGSRMSINEADDFEYMQNTGLCELNKGPTMLLIEE